MPKAGVRLSSPHRHFTPGVAPCRYPAAGVRGDSDAPSAGKIRVGQREGSSIGLADVGSERTSMRVQGGGAGGLGHSQVRGKFLSACVTYGEEQSTLYCTWPGDFVGYATRDCCHCLSCAQPACRLKSEIGRVLFRPLFLYFSQPERVC